MTEMSAATAAAAGTIDIAGDLTVNRLGFGAMRITGTGVWGEPPDRDAAKAVLRRADRARRELHRHRRLLRTRCERDTDRRSAVSIPRRSRDRDEGWPRATRSGEMDGQRAARISPSRHVRERCAGCGSSRSRSTSSTDPTPRYPLRSQSARSPNSRSRARSATSASATSVSRNFEKRNRSPRSCRCRTGTTRAINPPIR